MQTRLLPCLLLAAPLVHAQVSLVNFNSTDYVAGSPNLVLPTPTLDGVTNTNTWAVSTSASLIPSSGYTGPTFYGGIEYTRGGSASAPTLGQTQVVNNATADRITIGSGRSEANQTLSTLIFFKKENFINGAASGESVSFNSTSTATIRTAGSSTATGGVIRAAVLNDGVWYLSSSSVVSGFSGSLTIANLSAQSWGVFDPADLSAAPSSFTVAGSTFTDIQALGFWGQAIRGATANLVTISVDQIDFTGLVAVPEPSSAAALAGLGVLGLAGLRRRRR